MGRYFVLEHDSPRCIWCLQLSQYNKRQKLTVFGYIRQRVDVVLPLDIIKLLVSFYKSQDDWDRLLSHDTIKVDDDYIAIATASSWTIGFGKDRIEERPKEWILKLFRIDSAIIGIVPSDQIHRDCNSGDYTDYKHTLSGYGLCGANGVFYSGHSGGKRIGRIHKDDIIVMRLELEPKYVPKPTVREQMEMDGVAPYWIRHHFGEPHPMVHGDGGGDGMDSPVDPPCPKPDMTEFEQLQVHIEIDSLSDSVRWIFEPVCLVFSVFSQKEGLPEDARRLKLRIEGIDEYWIRDHFGEGQPIKVPYPKPDMTKYERMAVEIRKRSFENQGTLSYKINNGDYKVATRSVSVDTTWTLAVGFYGRGKVQLLK